MKFINCLTIAVALAATAASAAPVVDSKETFTATLDEGHLNHEAMEKRWANPASGKVMKKRFYRPPDALLKRAETPENSRGNSFENPGDREAHPDVQISRRAWHGAGSPHCIDKTRGCYSEE